MEAKAQSFTFLGTEGLVKIPFFQRGYVWSEENWSELLEDLYDTKKNHFLGSIILKQQTPESGKAKEVLVIDGQQRLTTISILIKALFDTFPEETQAGGLDDLKKYLFYKVKSTDKEHHIKIEHSSIDVEFYAKIIKSELSLGEYNLINQDSNKILQCYKYFREELSRKGEDENSDLFNRILNSETKILVLIDLNENEDEQAIFDTINSAGVRLSSADIIKNAIFQKSIDLIKSKEKVLKLYKETWEDVFSRDEETATYWATERPSGRIMRDNIETLLHSIAVIKGFFDPDAHILSDLSNLYKNHIKDFTSEQLVAFINEIKNFAELFKEEIVTFDKATIFSYKNDFQRLLHVLDVMEISTFHPFILKCLYKHKNNEDAQNFILRILENHIVRRMITKQSTKNYNKICKDLISDENLIDSKFTDISNEDVLAGLQNISNKNAALLLFWIELFRRDQSALFDIKELKYSYSLEHIMPQKWEEHWGVVPVLDISGGIISDENMAKQERKAKIYSIGNMTLLSGALNSSLRNYTFEKKIAGESKKKGVKDYADLSITKTDIIKPFDAGDRSWDETKINLRTKSLGDEICKIWNIAAARK